MEEGKGGLITVVVVTVILLVLALMQWLHCSLGWVECVGPWLWWYALSESDQASWAEAIGTVSAVIVALVIPFVGGILGRRAEKAAAKRHAPAIAVKVVGILDNIRTDLFMQWTELSVMGQQLEDVGALMYEELPNVDLQELTDTLTGSVHFHRDAADKLFELIPELDAHLEWFQIGVAKVSDKGELDALRKDLHRRVHALSNKIAKARETVREHHLLSLGK